MLSDLVGHVVSAIVGEAIFESLFPGRSKPEPWLVLGGALIVAMVAGVLAQRALEVTRRRRALTRFGLWLSRATVLSGLLAAVLAIAGVNVHAP
jgi:hypothetical protein